MLSPSVSVPTADAVGLHPTSSRRRALSYLRHLSHSSQTRSGSGSGSPTGAESPRSATSPRSLFHRSTSYPEQRSVTQSRQRSNSRPSERAAVDHFVNEATTRLNNPILEPRPISPTEGETTNTENEAAPEEHLQPEEMARNRRSSLEGVPVSALAPNTRPRATRALTAGTTGTVTDGPVAERDTTAPKPAALPAIRFFPHLETRSNGRQPLNFTPVSRTLPSEESIIRVGRYSEREGVPTPNPVGPSDAPVGFKSKVVSRKHCEFTCTGGQWFIKDVASSSGTFLNHVRLSPPNTESKPFAVKDGDIVQLGIDFRGGEEMIFRCVKIRIECNRAWQKKPNNFNKQRHAQLQMLSKDQPAADANSGECSICLGRIAPCQFLFVAPCAHTWHYKCIRPMLEGKGSSYPQFQCPNCRAYWDLTADVDVEMEDFAEDDESADSASNDVSMVAPPDNITVTPAAHDEAPRNSPGSLLSRRQATNPESSEINSVTSGAIEVPRQKSATGAALDAGRVQTPDGDRIINGEGPLTPRNDVGPFILDGSAGRISGRRVAASIPEVADLRQESS